MSTVPFLTACHIASSLLLCTVLLTLLLLCFPNSNSLHPSLVAHSTILRDISDSSDVPTYIASYEVDSFKAVKILHSKLDYDADGEVDDAESKKFLESDKINDNAAGGAISQAQRLRYLHQDGKDRSISVDELWEAWKGSQVYNWTTDEMVYWLTNIVELSEYSQLFEKNSINGTLLPRLAADSQFLSKLGITDPSVKSKMSIKAMDVVLFGPPKLGNQSKLRDFVVAVFVVFLFASCSLLYHSKIVSQRELREIQDSKLESLKKAETQMLELQQELEKALKFKEAVVEKTKSLEQQLELQRNSSASLLSDQISIGSANRKLLESASDSATKDANTKSYIAKLEEDLKVLRKELKETVDAKKFRAPLALRNLLQTTYDIESQYFNEKKLNLESKAAEVKVKNQKLQKKKTSFLGYYKMAQENSLEEDINTIVEVKEAIMQVTKEIRARTERWKAIEEACGCSLDFLCK